MIIVGVNSEGVRFRCLCKDRESDAALGDIQTTLQIFPFLVRATLDFGSGKGVEWVGPDTVESTLRRYRHVLCCEVCLNQDINMKRNRIKQTL